MSFYVLTAQVVGSGQSDASVVNLLIHVALVFTRDAVKSRLNAAHGVLGNRPVFDRK